MRCVDEKTMRAAEAAAIAAGTPASVLMRNAGIAAAQRIEVMCEAMPALGRNCRIATVIGRGNNGGDGIVAAGVLARKHEVVIFSSLPREALRGDGANFAKALPDTVSFRHSEHLSAAELAEFDVVIDAVFGIGFAGTAHPPLADYLAAMRDCGRPIVSLDIPSGIHTDDGTGDFAVSAFRTLTFGLPKRGLFANAGDTASGVVEILPIGLEKTGMPIPDNPEVLSRSEAAAMLPRLSPDSHKNTRGRVLVCCGSPLYRNAPVLAARGAAAGGAGMIRLLWEKRPTAPIEPAWICRKTSFDADTRKDNADFFAGSDVVLAGCGWGDGKNRPALLKTLLASGGKLVLDADALNCAARCPELWHGGKNIIITPHPGEAARLERAFRIAAGSDRLLRATALARKMKCVVLLKGHHSIIADPSGRCAVNPNGTPALATAGSGDVLAGLTAAFFADGRPPFEAAQLAAFCHGGAADYANTRSFCANELDRRIADFMAALSAFA